MVDGVTGATVAGALGAHPGDAVAVERAGYLRRDTIVPRDGLVSLWPMTVDLAYVQTVVYSETAARNRLLRWATTTIPVPRDFPSDVTEAVRPWVALVPSDSPAVAIVVDPNDPGFATLDANTIGFAFTQISDADAHILSTRLVFKSDFDLNQPGNLLHEMGHALGLHHSARVADIMFPSTARTTTTFSADERVLLTMMYAHRRSGQIAPDDDRAVGQAATSSTAVIRVISP
ncbi:MAG TPA: matrixin family metalloprotease [Vicinamibacteria bacterium]|nr:matrixin family metalloprotease [Vicinamibacteria bacterium]